MLTDPQRDHFDSILEELIADLPEHIWEVLEEVPLIVEDEPTRQLLEEMDVQGYGSELCGLHSGIPLTHRSVEHGSRLPDRMMLFRGPIMRVSGRRLRDLREQIRVTLLHEIGHHFGLDEDDLDDLGYA